MQDPPAAAGVAAVDQLRRHVLVVEDDEMLRQTIRWALEEEGVEVEIAADGQEAVDSVAQRRPRLVLLDMGLPLINGDGVASAIRAQYGLAVPVIVLTADGRAAEKAERVGAVAYLHKPFEIDDLISTVQASLGTGGDGA